MEQDQIILRPLESEDYPFFYRLRTDLSSIHLWERTDHIPHIRDYYEELDNLRRNQQDMIFAITEKADLKLVGLIYSFNTSLVDGFSFVGGIIAPEYRRRKLGAQALFLFLKYSFSTFPLRKIYADVIEYNTASLALVRKTGFVEEGNLRHHRYHDGKYWNNYRYAFYREKLQDYLNL